MEPLTVRRQGDPAHGLVPGWPLAVFRIAFGVLYLDMAFQKAPWRGYGWLEGFIRKEIDHPTFPWMAAFLRDVVLAHFELFGALTFVTEATLGVALLLGLFTRLAAAIGVLWQINIALQAFNVPGEWYWIWPLLVLPQFTFAAAGAGRVLGLDAILRRRRSADRTGGAFDGFVRLAT